MESREKDSRIIHIIGPDSLKGIAKNAGFELKKLILSNNDIIEKQRKELLDSKQNTKLLTNWI